jgi:curved DNA-binding protein CbpA
MTNHFKECKTKEDVKRLYRELAKKFHPDAGGRAEDMVELQRQYETWKEPSPFRSYSNVNERIEEELKEAFERATKEYGGYGGYRYNNQSTMYNEFKQQSNDPRLADYERMKSENQSLRNDHWTLRNDNIQLKFENDALKKKLERIKKRLNPSKKKEKNMSKPIHL